MAGSVGLDRLTTPFGSAKNVLGGSASYAGLAASLFARPIIVSIIGRDFPKHALEQLTKRADLSGVKRQGKIFRWQGRYEFDLSSAITEKTDLGSLAGFRPELPESAKQAGFLFLANLDPTAQLQTLDRHIKLRGSRPFVMLDTMNFWIERAKPALTKLISRVDLLALNEGEARQFCSEANLITAGRKLLAAGPGHVIVKKGEHGALLFSNEGVFLSPGYPLETVQDPTGAGDSFDGSLIGFAAKKNDVTTKTLRQAMTVASAVASFTTESIGPDRLLSLNQREIAQRTAVLKQMVRL